MTSLNLYTSTTGGGKRDIMRAFGDGAKLHDVEVNDIDRHQYVKSNFAMIFAYKSEGTDTPNHKFREEVVKKHNDNIFFVDSNVLKSYENDIRYFRFPKCSIHPHEANYMIDGDKSRNNQVIKDMNIEIKPWRTEGKHICLFLNRGIGGFSTFGKPCYEWAKETVEEIRKYSDRPILIRSHKHAGTSPQLAEDKKNLDYILSNYKDITHTELGKTNIHDDLKNAWACVVHTSTSGTVALLEGIPMFATHKACFSYQWSAGKLSEIENPIMKDRTNFITYYANSHWNLDEVRKGLLWSKYVS